MATQEVPQNKTKHHTSILKASTEPLPSHALLRTGGNTDKMPATFSKRLHFAGFNTPQNGPSRAQDPRCGLVESRRAGVLNPQLAPILSQCTPRKPPLYLEDPGKGGHQPGIVWTAHEDGDELVVLQHGSTIGGVKAFRSLFLSWRGSNPKGKEERRTF